MTTKKRVLRRKSVELENLKPKLLLAGDGYLDAVEVMGTKYIGLCNVLNQEPSDGIGNQQEFVSWLKASITGDELMAIMSDDFYQGFVTGIIKSAMDWELLQQVMDSQD